MAKKKGKETTVESLPETVSERGREVWLAGLGALSTAEEEGTKLFHRLIKKGQDYEKEGRKQIKEVSETVEKQQDAISERVRSTVAETVEVALERFGVPTQAEVEKLTKQVDRLTKKVEQLTKALDQQKKT